MAGVTTLPVREFFSRLGVALTHTEMISCSGLIRNNAKTNDMLKISEHEGPLVLQLFASDENVLISGAECALKTGNKYSALGINMACPMPKITRNGCGSALLKYPEKASRMVKGLKSLGLPVWVKIRKFENNNDTLNFVDMLLRSGADNICIHGRTPAQRYEGISDREIILQAAEKFSGYISASGDVKTVEDIREYLSFGCAAVMIARGAVSNPFLCEEFYGIFRTPEERFTELVKFATRAKELSGEHKAIVLLKRFSGSILKYKHGTAELRRLALLSDKLGELIDILKRGNNL